MLALQQTHGVLPVSFRRDADKIGRRLVSTVGRVIVQPLVPCDDSILLRLRSAVKRLTIYSDARASSTRFSQNNCLVAGRSGKSSDLVGRQFDHLSITTNIKRKPELGVLSDHSFDRLMKRQVPRASGGAGGGRS